MSKVNFRKQASDNKATAYSPLLKWCKARFTKAVFDRCFVIADNEGETGLVAWLSAHYPGETRPSKEPSK